MRSVDRLGEWTEQHYRPPSSLHVFDKRPLPCIPCNLMNASMFFSSDSSILGRTGGAAVGGWEIHKKAERQNNIALGQSAADRSHLIFLPCFETPVVRD